MLHPPHSCRQHYLSHQLSAAATPYRVFLLRQRLASVTEKALRAELERRDPSVSGVLSEQALAKALRTLGADLQGSDLGRLMHRFDVEEVRYTLKFTYASELDPATYRWYLPAVTAICTGQIEVTRL